MLPENKGFNEDSYTAYPDKTYGIDLSKKRICGYYDGIAAIYQAVYKILATIRFKEIIYSDNYGTELMDYMDRLTPFVWSEIEHTITKALLNDDRITSVEDFAFTEDKRERVLRVRFTVKTALGAFTYTKEVENYV